MWGKFPVSEDTFDRLLKALPDIAIAVNQFESSTVQEQAFEALARALGVAESSAVGPSPSGATGALGSDSAASMNGEANGEANEVENPPGATTPARRKRRRSSQPVSEARDTDFRPDGKQSLRGFVGEKKPDNNFERNVVAVYYLEQVLNLSSVTAGHVLAAYKECDWPEPGDMVNSLAKTASMKHWLDTSNTAAIRTTAPGRNFVKHDMPAKKAAKV